MIAAYEESPGMACVELSVAYGTKPYMPRGPYVISSTELAQLYSPHTDRYAASIVAAMCLSAPGHVNYDDGGDGAERLPANGIPRVQVCGNILPTVSGLGEGDTAVLWEQEVKSGVWLPGGRQWYIMDSHDPTMDGYHFMSVKVAEILASKQLKDRNLDIADSCPRVRDVFSSASAPEQLASKVRIILTNLVLRGGSLDSVPMAPLASKSYDLLAQAIRLFMLLQNKFPPPI